MTREQSNIRKQKIKELLAEGFARKEIAARLKIKGRTLDDIIHRALKAGRYKNTTEWVAKELV
jgi:DNA-binding NarL/FixJ family response regulator